MTIAVLGIDLGKTVCSVVGLDGEGAVEAMTIAVLGIDLGKTVCSVVGLDGEGAVVLRRRMRRQTAIDFASGLEPCAIAMEACCGARLPGRILADRGHEIRLMSPEYVRPYVKAQKNDCGSA